MSIVLDISHETRVAYERFFFERICAMKIDNREDYSILLDAGEEFVGLRYACVQDTVERLTEVTHRLSTFQWRNVVFAYIRKGQRPNELYEKIYDSLKTHAPSLFVRSYVYVVFIKVPEESLFDSGDGDSKPSSDSFQIYLWNTKYEIALQHKKKDLLNLNGQANKVFLVANPEAELQRIQDANSDVIDAVKAFMGNLPLVEQTQNFLDEICRRLDSGGNARILLQGPARSGKTIIAMSLLSKYPTSRMLLMNWYFYDALQDAFEVFYAMSKDDIARIFTASQETWARAHLLREIKQCIDTDPALLKNYIEMRLLKPEKCQRQWRWKKSGDDWTLLSPHPNCNVGREVPKKGDWVCVFAQKPRPNVSLVKLDVSRNGLFSVGEPRLFFRRFLDEEGQQENEQFLKIIEGNEDSSGFKDEETASSFVATLVKELAEAVKGSEQRFFHHDLSSERADGCWRLPQSDISLVDDTDFLICDESQRLGDGPDSFDEVGAVLGHHTLFLCGDDWQMLNPAYDDGINELKAKAGAENGFVEVDLPSSVGIPEEVELLVKWLLSDEKSNTAKPPAMQGVGFSLKLIHDDDIGLVSQFNNDGSIKKHFAIPNHSHKDKDSGFYMAFYPSGFYPEITKSFAKTDRCTAECKANCVHRCIQMIPKDLRSKYKYFCAEAIMPNYALSAYELISREVESLYLKIPKELGGVDIVTQPELEVNGIANKWRKNHLYVLMTRATLKLVINVEDKGLFDYFVERCRQTGLKDFVL